MATKHDHHIGDGPMDSHHNYRRKLDWQFSDESLGQKAGDLLGEVCALLKEYGEIRFCNIDVTVNQGIVTLQGNVESLQIKRLAENIACSIEGVKKVLNQLRVKTCQRDQPQVQSRCHLAIVPPSASYAITLIPRKQHERRIYVT